MVTAAVNAKGETEIGTLKHIDRGYENFVQKLNGLGIDATRINVPEMAYSEEIDDARV